MYWNAGARMLKGITPTSAAATTSLFWTKGLRDTTALCLAASKLVKSDQKARDGIFSELQEYEEEEKEQAKEKGKTTISHEDCSLNEINDLQSPQHVRSRGHPRKRLCSNLEKKIANEIKRKQKNTTDLH
ncbi:hypothetical protein PIB30_086492 [Stylosanthes scabra]|uniref:Uncharacterized protein n=1 Tax=Stylosanthes scabra TaxID=79078 RepID=A0ABU6SU33_9FABA|nr:hypothetical protein [Stylosanthes scabra]